MTTTNQIYAFCLTLHKRDFAESAGGVRLRRAVVRVEAVYDLGTE